MVVLTVAVVVSMGDIGVCDNDGNECGNGGGCGVGDMAEVVVEVVDVVVTEEMGGGGFIYEFKLYSHMILHIPVVSVCRRIYTATKIYDLDSSRIF